MRKTPFAFLLAVTAAACAAAGWTIAGRASSDAVSFTPGPLAPGMDARLNEVTELAVSSPDGDFTVRRNADGVWGVVEKDGYPINVVKLEDTLIGLSTLDLVARKTADPAFFPRLNLVTPDPTDAAPGEGARLTAKAGDAVLVDVILGKARDGENFAALGGEPGGSFFLRRADENQTWVANGRLDLTRQQRSWLQVDLPQIAPEDVVKVTVTPHGGPAYTLVPEGDGKFTMVGIAADEALVEPGRVSKIVEGAAFLRFDDVRKGEVAAPQRTAVYEAADGRRVTLRIVHEDGDAYWASLVAEGGAEGEPFANAATQIPGWSYRLPAFKAEPIFSPRDELVANANPPAPTDPAGTATPPVAE